MPAVVKTLQERAKTMLEMADGAIFYYCDDFVYDAAAAEKHATPAALSLLGLLVERLEKLPDYDHQALELLFKGFCEEQGIKFGQIGPVVRIALSGGTVSPGIYEVIEVLGRDRTIARLRRAISELTPQ